MEKKEGLCWAPCLHACPLPGGILGTSRKQEALALICWILKRNTLLSRHPQGTLTLHISTETRILLPFGMGRPIQEPRSRPDSSPHPPFILPPVAHPTFQRCFSVYSKWRVISLSRVGADMESRRPSPSPGGLRSSPTHFAYKAQSPLPDSTAPRSWAPPPSSTVVQRYSSVTCMQTLLGVRCKETTAQQKTFNQKVVLPESCSPSVPRVAERISLLFSCLSCQVGGH